MKKFNLFSIIVFILLVSISYSSADGGGPQRKITAAEKAFYEAVYKTLLAALPKVPEGWQAEEGEEYAAPEDVSEGFGKEPVRVYVHRGYKRIIPEKEQQEKMDIGAGIMKENQAAFEKIMKKQEELAARMAKAGEAMDMAEIERLKPEVEKNGKLAEELAKAQDKKLSDSPFGDLSKNIAASVHFEVNEPSYDVLDNAKEIAPAGGARAAFRYELDPAEKKDGREGRTVCLFGKWEKVKDGERVMMNAKIDAGLPHTTVQSVKVEITGAAETVEKLMKTMDLNSVKGMVK